MKFSKRASTPVLSVDWRGAPKPLLFGLASLAGLIAVGCETDIVDPTPVGEAPQAIAPATISGGTLLVSGNRAVVAQSDVDRLVVVDLASHEILQEHQLEKGDEPGRGVVGKNGLVHVALRGSGALATLDLASGELTRTEICGAPRGLAYRAPTEQIYVACAGGELVTLDAAGAVVESQDLGRDLRDVVVNSDGSLLVSRFRSAEVLRVKSDGTVVSLGKPGTSSAFDGFTGAEATFESAVAWRMIQLPGSDESIIVHQRGRLEAVAIHPKETPEPEVVESPYGGGGPGNTCGGGTIVHAAMTRIDAYTATSDYATGLFSGGIGTLVLPVDVAASATHVAVAAAGSDKVMLTSKDSAGFIDNTTNCPQGELHVPVDGEPVAVAFQQDGNLLVQTRFPAILWEIDSSTGSVVGQLALGGEYARHLGHALFHRQASVNSPIACASCHPEGREDGRTWLFEEIGARRTQTVAGGILETLPLHWDGQMSGLEMIMGDVFVNRMGGHQPSPEALSSLTEFLGGLPALPRADAADEAAVARGEELFYDEKVACGSCHVGGHLTNNENRDVGTGGPLQVPSLVGIADRAPYMHTGCAATLAQRFDTTCGGGDAHGKTSHLSSEQIADLVAYLETL